MKRIERTALLPYSAEQMFLVVNDVRSYPEFLPWCVEARVIAEDATEMTARLTVAKAGIHQSFTTRNTLQRPTSIDIALLEGPFKTLAGGWRFQSLGENEAEQPCMVELRLGFEFERRLMNLTFGKVFQLIADSMVDTFCARADALYAGQGTRHQEAPSD